MRTALKTWQEIVDHQTGEIAALRSEILGLKSEILNVERLYRERLAEQCQTCRYRTDHLKVIHP